MTNRESAWLHARMTAVVKSSKNTSVPRKAASLAEKEPLQVRIPTKVKRAFKSAAALRGMEPHELFVEVWNHYEQTRPIEVGKGGEK